MPISSVSRHLRLLAICGLALLLTQTPAVTAPAAPTLEPTRANVIYGMYSGLALLLDVYQPADAAQNHIGLLLIPGSGWAAPMDMSARPLKEDATVRRLMQRLLAGGYTVFVIDHRAAPRFHYPDQLDDARRAARFIRHHAADFGIEATRLGGLGYSSGANLIALLAVQPGEPAATDADPVNHESSRLQCVVADATPTDLTHPSSPAAFQMLTAYLGQPVAAPLAADSDVARRLVEASPITYITADDPPMLFVHGVNDPIVPIDTVHAMASRLTAAGVRTRVIDVAGASHWPLDKPGAPDLADETLGWFDSCFRPPASR
jgi:acetyl esterase/lipase